MMSTTERRIYVACLASYNAGCLHGVWIDTEGKDADDLMDEVRERVLLTSPYPNVEVECPDCDGDGAARRDDDGAPNGFVLVDCPRCRGRGVVPSAEEWAIHDHEGFGGLLGEYDSFERVAALDRSLEEHGEAFLAFLSAFGERADPEKFSDAYMGQYDSGKAFAEEHAVEVMGLIADDHPLFSYIDFEHYWNADLGHSFTFEDGYVFDSNW